MNLQKMFKMQAELDNRIIREKGLEGQDLLPNTYVALITELGEFANEGRWFKHWSENQEPNRTGYIDCDVCVDQPGRYEVIHEGEKLSLPCPKCEDHEEVYVGDRLLEEYVDCLHFFLSIAIKKGWKEDMHIPEESLFDFKKENFEGGLSGVYLEMQWRLLNSRLFKNEDVKNLHFQSAWDLFLEIGIVGFGFTLDQIEEAYMNKNAVNHKRQQEGY
ncbi:MULTISPECIES: dUTP diphosphatase [Bacillus]|uniref:dUTP diphosphatase n=1 Tax=Bacillus safensis TaxID=561879 RepID=UPI00226F7D6F|nr:dUTP diphosphatase [Bacillus safensis]MCY1096756.1 dUTP diphosphatase [Bacillus safensis]MEC2427689.1 dUTP diphosphatase [Bacillus safensis]